MNLVILVSSFLGVSLYGASFPCEKLLQKAISDRIPEVQSVQIRSFRPKGECNEKSTLTVLSPDVPLGFSTFEIETLGRRFQGSAEVRAFADVAVANTPMPHGETITEAHLRLERREISRLAQSGYFTNLKLLAGKQTKGALSQFQVIGRHNTQTRPTITAGENITLSKKRNSLVVSAKVRSLQSGLVDQWIQVQNPQTGKLFLARVTGPGEAEVR
jgi:flagella basal body P-ring formation protein FlgA